MFYLHIMGIFFQHGTRGHRMELPHINCLRQCRPAWLPVNRFWSFQRLRLKLKVIPGLGVAVDAIHSYTATHHSLQRMTLFMISIYMWSSGC